MTTVPHRGQIQTDIEADYISGTFILKRGELGDYLGMKSKELDRGLL